MNHLLGLQRPHIFDWRARTFHITCTLTPFISGFFTIWSNSYLNGRYCDQIETAHCEEFAVVPGAGVTQSGIRFFLNYAISAKGSSLNYVDRIFEIFDTPPPLVDKR